MKKFDGAKVTKFREEYEWSKTYLGELLGVSQQAITDIEYNRNKTEPNWEFQKNIAELLGVSVDELYSEEEDIEYHFKPSGSRKAKKESPFKKLEFGIERFLESSKEYDTIVEVECLGERNSRIDAWSFLDLYGDRKIRGIKTEIEKEITSTYRDNELIDEDETITSIIVLYVKSSRTGSDS